ncbi:pseudouridine synthase [uncultured Traorella sp.]|uniref:pseudouridine synthase n=1 Tax=uncultured Traorella sp. TaxID=1929048 RepID=UPI0025E3D3BF|nr:pseudouridine synthase [uncultured Traorella sp.]
MRLDKYLAHANLGTRKEVKALIRQSRIKVNGCVVKKEDLKINEAEDIILFNDQRIIYQKYVYYMLNKPQGVVSATTDRKDKTVLDCFDIPLRDDVFPIGRLDKDTEGLLLISNDGALAHRLLSLRYHVDKKYYVQCANEVTEEMLSKLEQVIELKDEIYQPGRAERISSKEIYLTIQEGKYHQVKRMLHHVGNEVVYLKRVAFGPLKLDARLKAGEWRSLSEDEIKELGGQL